MIQSVPQGDPANAYSAALTMDVGSLQPCPDGVGWDTISAYAGEASAVADPQHDGLVCSPAEASFDELAADELADATQYVKDLPSSGYVVKKAWASGNLATITS